MNEHACRMLTIQICMFSCSVFGSNAIAFRNLGVVSKIVKYLHIQDTLLQEASVRALYHLSRDPANCVIIHKNGGVKVRYRELY